MVVQPANAVPTVDAVPRVGRDTDVAAVLGAVLDRADLVSFSYQPPTLSELFRQAVAA